MWYVNKADVERRETIGRFRSLNPNMINHFASRPGTCIGAAGAMSASRGLCALIRLVVLHGRLHASPPAGDTG